MAMKMRPMKRKVGMEVLGVKMGFHAGSFCCLNAEAKPYMLN